MKKNNMLQKIASGKGFYITVAVSFCLIIFAVVLVYRTSTNMLKGILTVPNDVTQQARQNETDEADPRYEPDFNITLPTQDEPETSLRWDNIDENQTATTTEKATEAAIINDSYILPSGNDIQRDFSPAIPTYDITMGDWRTHRGIDFSAEEGSEIKAVGNGKVTRVLSDRSYGYILEIDHGDFTARYCGLEQENALKLGDTVKKGDTVGKAGLIPCEAGQESHFHFEVIKNGVFVDPLEAMGKTE